MITYGITVSDEFFEFKRLINSLQPYLLPEEDIVILADKNKITKEIEDFCELCGLQINYFNFQKDFSEFKNTLFSLTSKQYLFQIDADEQIPPSLLSAVRQVAQQGEIDLLWIPRINIIRGMTKKDIDNFNWKINEYGWEGFPDYQARFVSTRGHIRWQNKVHEILTGSEKSALIQTQPITHYSILHVKDIEKQKKQNNLYSQI